MRTRLASVQFFILCGVLILLHAAGVCAQSPDESQCIDKSPDDETSPTVYHHDSPSRFWVSGQINVIFEAHPSFPAGYSGQNSLKSTPEAAVSNLLTLYTGVELDKNTELLLDVESAGGHGLSNALGLAGFTNLDVVRSPDLRQTPYLARLLVRRIIPLGGHDEEAERNYLSLAPALPARRLEIRAGKFSLVDFFDVNAVGSDSHLQFMNWTADNNGAYDYAANTRGYTWGGTIEYQDHGWGARFAEALMPKVANGKNLDADLARSHAENLEFEIRHGLIPHRSGTVRLLSYLNHANMGSYRQAIEAFQKGLEPLPDITAHIRHTHRKYGFGVNFEQSLTRDLRAFARLGWSDGHNESFAYTEVDRTAALGADLRGNAWHRKWDKAGAAFVMNGLSADHREYLALGGHGFQLGDGRLTYGREMILEGYYTAHLGRGVFVSFDLQHVQNPGYNRDRGPVLVPGARLHVDF